MAAANRRSRTRRRRLLLAVLCFATAGWAIFFIPWVPSPDAPRLQQLAALLSLRSLQSRLWPSHSLERVIQPHQHTPLLPLLPYPQRLSLTGRFMLPSATEQAQRDTLNRLASEYETISADAQLMYNSNSQTRLKGLLETTKPASTEHMLPLDIYPGYAVAVTEQPQTQQQQQPRQQQQEARVQPLPLQERAGELASLSQPYAAASLSQQQQQQPQPRQQQQPQSQPQKLLPQQQRSQPQQQQQISLPQLQRQKPQQPQQQQSQPQQQQEKISLPQLQPQKPQQPQQQQANNPRPKKKGKNKKKSKASKSPKATPRPRIPATDPPEDPELQRLASEFVLSEIGASQQLVDQDDARMHRDADSGSALNVHLTVRKALPKALNQRTSTTGQSQVTQKQIPQAAMNQQAGAMALPQQAQQVQQQQIVHPAQKRVGAVFDGVGLQQTLPDDAFGDDLGDLPGGLASLDELDRPVQRLRVNAHAVAANRLDDADELDVMGLDDSQTMDQSTADSDQPRQRAAGLAGLRGLPVEPMVKMQTSLAASAADGSASLRRDPTLQAYAAQSSQLDQSSNAAQVGTAGRSGGVKVKTAQAVSLAARAADLLDAQHLWPRTTQPDARAATQAAGMDADRAVEVAGAMLEALGDDDSGADDDEVPDGDYSDLEAAVAYDPLNPLGWLKRAREAEFEQPQEEEAGVVEAEYQRQEALRAEQRQAEADAEVKKADALAAEAKKKAKEAADAQALRIAKIAMLLDKAHLDAYLAGPEWQEVAAAKWARIGRPGRSRGIVIASGGSVLLNHAYATIKVLREVHNCSLPIQIIYNGPSEMSPAQIAMFQTAFRDVTCIDGSAVPYPAHHQSIALGTRKADGKVDDESHKDVSGFTFKIWALAYATTFDEVLMLDSDNMPLRNPEYLFNSYEYQQHGALFFPDWWEKGWVKADAYTMFGLDVPWGKKPKYVTSESGQLLLDRAQHVDVLEWLWFLNSHQNVTYKLMYGDKDTFRLAFTLADKKRDFKQVTTAPRAPLDANPSNAPPITFRHVGMMQHDPAGNVAFLHRTAEGKFYAFEDDFRRVDYISLPLSPKRAKACLHKNMGYRADQIDLTAYEQCPVADPKLFHKQCKLNVRSAEFPIPVMPVGDIPELSRVLEAANAIFEQIQRDYKQSLQTERLNHRHS